MLRRIAKPKIAPTHYDEKGDSKCPTTIELLF